MSGQTLTQVKEHSDLTVRIVINHFQSTATIQFDEENRNEYTCRVLAADNRLLLKFVKEPRKSEYLIPLDHLRSGSYILTVESPEGKNSYTFTK